MGKDRGGSGRPGSGAVFGQSPKQTSHRTERVAKEIREVLGSFMLTGYRGEIPLGHCTLTRVIVSGDLRTAKVFFSLMVLNETDEKKIQTARKLAAIDLNNHAYEMQELLAHKLKMRYTPKLSFLFDEGFEEALRVEGILRKLSSEKK